MGSIVHGSHDSHLAIGNADDDCGPRSAGWESTADIQGQLTGVGTGNAVDSMCDYVYASHHLCRVRECAGTGQQLTDPNLLEILLGLLELLHDVVHATWQFLGRALSASAS